MRISIASITSGLIPVLTSMLLGAACGPAPKPEGPVVNEGPAVSDTCCCKSTPIASPDGLPIYEAGHNRMECSTKQGTCVDDVQCQGKGEEDGSAPASGLTPGSEPPPPPQGE